jgi:hypothetical protein
MMAAPHRRRAAPTRADLVLLAALIAAVPLSRQAVGAAAGGAAGGTRLALTGAGSEESADLRQDGEYSIAGPIGTTIVRVQDGEAWIAQAPCTNRLCVRMGRLRGPGRALVCLPNRVVVRVAGTAADVDAIAR